jgi:hypothetical protein
MTPVPFSALVITLRKPAATPDVFRRALQKAVKQTCA